MIRRILNHFFFGMPFGITYGLLVTLGYSYGRGDTFYQPAEARFAEHFSSNLDVLLISIILWALFGSLFSVTALVFEIERWSLARQTLTHFATTVSGFMIIAYFAGWYPLDLASITSEIFVFVIIYLVVWGYSMLRAKRSVDAINKKIKKEK
ncbi:hypothetical protein FC65_GL001188 [Ligilactobacillus acidipiscis DSM 15836]|jgi:fatty acid desaturase|uniref:DUF3021 domain-containing protein n=2 Tax=Ligilactobacillus acidipiscis TaxID=89059 RepID=A0A1K1KS45_9LACO|nr:DUF3021 domain-containing protein [Ligilactobacillus acidipiscis]KRM19850.1 hypothetical protein FC65_GL001188 [Ligilactobacillus acidipiscis DSM 15836]GAW64445.1 hypothetical protein Lacidipiscis_01639 [Ligilactobacillus acidipiscis]GEN21654.1 membrane protein [Ligilactobacillus acidipiscis]SFV41681.1 hypothetical protein LAC1533_2255 [Ligilactobacillus acidipiscis]